MTNEEAMKNITNDILHMTNEEAMKNITNDILHSL
jgi:hypothetical protein